MSNEPTQPSQPSPTVKTIDEQGFKFHVHMALGCAFDKETTQAVSDAVLKNAKRIESQVGGEFDIPINKIF
jgi:hypothetical protein